MRRAPRAVGAPVGQLGPVGQVGQLGIGQEEQVEQTQSREGADDMQRPVTIAEASVVAQAALNGASDGVPEPAAPAAGDSTAAADAEPQTLAGGEDGAGAPVPQAVSEARGDEENLPVGGGDEAEEGEVADEDTADDGENLTTLSERLDGILESLMLASGAPLTVRRMVEVIRGTNGKEVRAALARLAEQYAGVQRGIHLVEVAGAWQFRTAPQNIHYVRVLLREKPARLGRAALETLSIVAYKQPATRAEIEAIRGVDADSALNTLLQKKLVKIAGRKEVVGRPLLYATTAEFLEVFGLKDLKELPTLKEIGPVAEPEDEADIEDEQLEGVAAESDDEGEEAVEPGERDEVAEEAAESDTGSNGAAEESPVRRTANGDDDADDLDDDADEDDDLDDADEEDFDEEDDDFAGEDDDLDDEDDEEEDD